MLISTGHINDMISRLKSNRDALGSKKAKFKAKKLLSVNYKSSGEVIEEVKITREELEAIKTEIRSEARAAAIRYWSILSVVIVLFVALGIWAATVYL